MENNNTKLDIKAFLDKDEQKDLLRFLTAGSVDADCRICRRWQIYVDRKIAFR